MKLHTYSTQRLNPNRIPSLRIRAKKNRIGLSPRKPPIPKSPGRA